MSVRTLIKLYLTPLKPILCHCFIIQVPTLLLLRKSDIHFLSSCIQNKAS